ncbi:MAG: TonB-dependent receptor [Desulfuromonadales bacterium]|nr:MAG: TonB-dependent receptor [Desulfuromonadales bacterium]
MHRLTLQILRVFFVVLVLTAMFVPHARAISDEERKTLEMFFDEQDRVVTVTRTPKPISQVAENITVITAEQIERMNAHTLDEVLVHVAGVQVLTYGGPGNASMIFVYGSEFLHVRYILDGVSLNGVTDGGVDTSFIPVQSIDRIEIIKGVSSSIWGSATGGVINIITKSPVKERAIGGTISASAGSRATSDARVELTGSLENLGYYMTVSGLRTDGFVTNNNAELGNTFGKVVLNSSLLGETALNLGYSSYKRKSVFFKDFNIKDEGSGRYFLSSLYGNYNISDNISLSYNIYSKLIHGSLVVREIDTNNVYSRTRLREFNAGGTLLLNHSTDMNKITFGSEFDNGYFDNSEDGVFAGNSPMTMLNRRIKKLGLFLSDTIILGDFSLSPSVRYDRTNVFGGDYSTSLGITWKITDRTLLRVIGGRGFSLPVLYRESLGLSEVYYLQAGFETSQLKYLSLKASCFRSEGKKEIFDVNVGKLRKQGVEAEFKTLPILNTSLQAGYVFIDAKNKDTGEAARNIPRYTINTALIYDDTDSFSAVLLGRYIWWNMDSFYISKYSSFILDLTLTKKIRIASNSDLELIFSAHNLTNSSQYAFGFAPNPGRWFEGGIRFKF